MSTQKVYVSIPGLTYTSTGPMWADMIQINAYINNSPVPVYAYNKLDWTSLTQVTGNKFYHVRYKESSFISQNSGFFTTMSDNLGFGKFKHYLFSEFEKKELDSIVHKNQYNTGGICVIEGPDVLNFTVTFEIILYTDVNYTDLTNSLESDVYNNVYMENCTKAPEFVKIGSYKCKYNPLTPSLIGDIGFEIMPSIDMFINKNNPDQISIDWSKSLLSNIEDSTKESTIYVPIGPDSGPESCNGLARPKDDTVVEYRKTQEKLIVDIPQIDKWLPDLSYKAVMFGDPIRVSSWSTNVKDSSFLKLFCGTEKNIQPYTLVGIHEPEIQFSFLEVTSTNISIECVLDLRTYFHSLGKVLYTSTITAIKDPQINWSSDAYKTYGNSLVFNSGFCWNEAVSTEVKNADKALFPFWETGTISGLAKIKEKTLYEGQSTFSPLDLKIEDGEYTNSSVLCNLDGDLSTVYTTQTSVSYSTIKNVTYGTIFSDWSNHEVLQDSDYGNVKDYLTVSVAQTGMNITFNHALNHKVSDCPVFKSWSDFKVIPYIVYKSTITDEEGNVENYSYTVGRHPIAKKVSIDDTKNYCLSADGELITLFDNPELGHSFDTDYTQENWYKWSSSEGFKITFNDPANTASGNWYLIKWTAIEITEDDSFSIKKNDYCMRFLYTESEKVEDIEIPPFKSSEESPCYVGNIGIFKITEELLKTNLGEKFPSTENKPLVDEDLLQQLSMCHCAAVYEDSIRFKGLHIDIAGGQKYKSEGIKYLTVYIPEPKYFCFGYYELGNNYTPMTIKEPYGHSEKLTILINSLSNQTIKTQAEN